MKIVQYTLNGKLVKVHNSATAAAIDMKIGGATNIINVLDTKNQSYGYLWKTAGTRIYKEIKVDRLYKLTPRGKMTGGRAKPVASYDDAGKLVKAYVSLTAAAIDHSIVSAQLNRSLNEPYFKTVGLYWSRINDVNNPPPTIEIMPTLAEQRRAKRDEIVAKARQAKKDLRSIYIMTKKGKPGKTVYPTLDSVAQKLGCTRERVRQALATGAKCKGHQIGFIVDLV